jgi:hypothetical protein
MKISALLSSSAVRRSSTATHTSNCSITCTTNNFHGWSAKSNFIQCMICEEFFELVFLTLPEKMLHYLEEKPNEFFRKFAMTVKLETNNQNEK